MQTSRYLVTAVAVLAVAGGVSSRAEQSASSAAVSHDHGSQTSPPATAMAGGHAHGSPVPAITFAELEQTVHRLAAARQATEKYQDVRTAEAAGYRPVGPNVPGMGLHYVRQTDLQHFSITDPPILLYERDAAASGSLRLIGVSYLLVAPGDADGQPVNPPFPKARHNVHRGVVDSPRRRAGWCTRGSGRTARPACSARRIRS
jgi:hypothetical protein